MAYAWVSVMHAYAAGLELEVSQLGLFGATSGGAAAHVLCKCIDARRAWNIGGIYSQRDAAKRTKDTVKDVGEVSFGPPFDNSSSFIALGSSIGVPSNVIVDLGLRDLHHLACV